VPESKIQQSLHDSYFVHKFVEKPPEEMAKTLINNGAYWNGGVFAFRLKYLMDILYMDINFLNFTDLYNKYNSLEKTSFDYKVVEKAKSLAFVSYNGKWSDIGTWRTLIDEMPHSTIGSVVSEKTSNTFVINELDIPIIALGTKDLVVVASDEGILVADLKESPNLKEVLERLDLFRN